MASNGLIGMNSKVNAFVLNILAEYFKVVTKEQLVHDQALQRGKKFERIYHESSTVSRYLWP
jgi:hypothetical protein